MEIIETSRGEIRVLLVKGKVDVITAPALREKIMGLLDGGARRLLINCLLLDYISSAGLRVLYETMTRLEAASGRLALCAVNSNVRKIFDAVDLSADIPIFPAEAEAVAHLEAPAK
jgi:anti-sigma B factor antagonist